MKAVFSCVVDDKPKYARQAVLWAASLLVHGGQSADSLVVHAVGDGDPKLRALLSSWGIKVVPVEPFDARHAPSNKLAPLGSACLQNADYIVLCDCDLAFVAPIAPWLRGDRIRANIVGGHWLAPAQWKRIFVAAKLKFPTERVLAGDGVPTLPTFCNGGLYVIPRALFSQISIFWPKWDRWLLERRELSKPYYYFADQISFTLACEELGLTIDYLPLELNFHTRPRRVAELVKRCGRSDCVPRVLHYHSFVGQRGFLQPTKIVSVNAAIERTNELIRCLNELYPVDLPERETMMRSGEKLSSGVSGNSEERAAIGQVA